jgi:hypothetical protein
MTTNSQDPQYGGRGLKAKGRVYVKRTLHSSQGPRPEGRMSADSHSRVLSVIPRHKSENGLLALRSRESVPAFMEDGGIRGQAITSLGIWST